MTNKKLIMILSIALGLTISSNSFAQGGVSVPVKVVIIKSEKTQIWNRYSGRAVAVNIADIRPQVSGIISEIKFTDGQTVKKGDVLMVIDPRPFEAAVIRAKAELKAAKNQASFNQKELARAKVLVKTDAISERVFDNRSNQSNVANANVQAAEAMVTQTEIDLDHAYVKAPFDGRMSRAEITVGNLVEAGPNAPILTSIVSNEGIYVDFEVDEKTYANSIRKYAKTKEEEQKIPVKIALDGTNVHYEGFIHTFDNRINPSTGTIRARAYFENKDFLLIPGIFTTVEMGRPQLETHILLNELAIGTNQDRKFVYVVNPENSTAEYRQIELGDSVKDKRIVISGLNEGEKIVVDGLIRVRPGVPLTPTEISPSSL